MKILLAAVNAKYIHSNPAVYSLKSCTGEYQKYVEILEFTINQQPSYILQEIYKKHPDVVAFSCYIWNRSMISQVIFDLKKILPDTDIWAGGPEVSYHTSETLRTWPLRGIMAGPGEGSFRHLVSAYVQGAAANLPSVLDQSNTPFMPLDKIPFWYGELGLEDFEHRIIYYESSRGCPFSCSYCLSSIDKTMDFRSVRRVCRELDFFLQHNVLQVKFIDRTFNCKKTHALPILQHILEHDNGITNFHFEIAADLLDEDYFALLKRMRPGAVQLEIGVQSTCEKTIAEIGRLMDAAKVAAAVMRIHSFHNIHIHLDLIAGLPFESLSVFQQSFNDVYALKPQQLQLGFLKVLQGSRMEQCAKQYRLLYTTLPPYEVLSTKWLSYEDIRQLKQIEEVFELYYNSGQFMHTLDFLLPFFDTPYAMYESLASWYDTHGLFGVQPSRVRKYEILLEFAAHIQSSLPKTSCMSAVLKEYLIYDLYLREHMKNRPSFAPSIECWKQDIHDILHQEAQTHALFPQLAGCNYRELSKTLHAEVFLTLFGQPAIMLFYYGTRDPLTHNCTTLCIKL